MKKAFFLAAALVAMVGCNKTIIESPVSNEADYGYINFDVTADTEMVVTKGMTADGTLDEYRICLYKVESSEGTTNEIPYWAGKTLADNPVAETGFITIAQARNNAELWKVPAGSYKIFVENNIEDNLYSDNGSVYLSDEKPVTVYAGLPATVELTCTPKNSKVSFIYTDEFKTVFNTDDLSVSVKEEDSRTVDLTPTHVSGDVSSIKDDLDAAYFHAAATLEWTMSVSTTANNAEPVEYSSDFTTVEGKWTIVTFSTGTTDGTINVTVTVNGEITETETISYTFKPATGEVEKKE